MYGFCDFDFALVAEAGVFSQTCSPMAAISISFPQSEHLIAGRKLAGLMPPAASVAASGIFVCVVVVVASQKRGVKMCATLAVGSVVSEHKGVACA